MAGQAGGVLLLRAGKKREYTLYLWPPHCLLGGDGHALVGVIQEARLFHAYARGAPDEIEIKGEHTLTECYSALGPEVVKRHDDGDLAQRNVSLMRELTRSDAVIVAGQAASHCVKSTLQHLLEAVNAQDPSRASRIYVMRDCMSAVAVQEPTRPGELLADFTDQAENALERFAQAGMQLVTSTTDVEEWRFFPSR